MPSPFLDKTSLVYLKKMLGKNAGVSFETDETLTLANGILSVNCAGSVEEDNTLPVTSAAVHTEIGNIDAILQSI